VYIHFVRALEAGMAVRILIVDDHEVVRQGVRSILQAQRKWEVCGEASDGHEAVTLAKQLNPDVIILDVTMPVMGGLAAASYILQSNRDSKILIFTMHESATLAKLVQKSGARGMVVKSQAGRNLIQAMEKVLAGETYFPAHGESVTQNQKH
jgi:DNA-binding NarL/FixJ family response regulator